MAQLEKRVTRVECLLDQLVNNNRKEPPSLKQDPVSAGALVGDSEDEKQSADLEPNMLEERMEDVAIGGLDNVRSMDESVWECVLLAGLPGVGRSSSCMMLAGFALNIILQLGFSFIALVYFETGLPTVRDAMHWRLSDAHSPTFMDQSLVLSLASRVCGEDETLSIATSQKELLTKIRAYNWNLAGVHFLGVGLTLCSLVVFTWSLIIAREMKDLFEFAAAVVALPDSPRTTLAKAGDTYILASTSFLRVAAILGVTACRFGVACVLCLAGMTWLCTTVDITELVLNAAALGFVLDLDQLIFSVLTPSSRKLLVQRMQPLRRHARHDRMALVGSCLLCLVLVCVSMVQLALPMSKQMDNIEHELCGKGYTEFVVEASSSTGLIVVANTSEFKDVTADPTASSWFRLYVKEILKGNYARGILSCTDNKWCPTIWRPPPLDYGIVKNLLTESGYPFIREWCYDLLDLDGEYLRSSHLAWLRSKYPENQTASTCADFSGYCDERHAHVVRWLCPKTCGCDQPRSGLHWDMKGCPTECLEQWDRSLRHIKCENVNPDTTPSDFLGFLRWLKNSVSHDSVPHDACENHTWLDGGDHFDGWTWENGACWDMWGGKLKTFCPVSCGCTDSSMYRHDGKCPADCAPSKGEWP